MYDRALTVLSEAESAQRAMSESYADSDVAGWARTSIALDTDQVRAISDALRSNPKRSRQWSTG